MFARFTLAAVVLIASLASAAGNPLRDHLARANAAVQPQTQVPATEVTVNCNAGETIPDALLNNNAAPYLTLTVNGNCGGTVYIQRHNVTIKGVVASGYGAALHGTFQVLSARNVRIQGFAINGAIDALEGASVIANNVSIKSSLWGISALKNAKVTIIGSKIRSNWVGVLAFENSTVELSGTLVVSDGQAPVSGYDGIHAAALVAVAQSRIMTHGHNRIVHTVSTDAGLSRLAIQVSENSALMVSGHLPGGAEIIGDILQTDRSSAIYKGVDMRGRLTLQDMSYATLSADTTHQGPIISESLSLVKFAPTVGAITGNIICRKSGRIDGKLDGLNIIGCTLL